MNDKVTLMKGNEALAMAMIRYGADGYFGDCGINARSDHQPEAGGDRQSKTGRAGIGNQ